MNPPTTAIGAEAPAAPPAPRDLIESYRQLADVFHEVLSEQSLDSLLETIASTVQDLIPHDDLAFYEADEETKTLRAVYARGEYAQEVLEDEPFAFGRGITGWAVARRQPVLSNRADLDPRVKFVAGTPPDPEALIAVPLIARGQVKGALNIYRAGLTEFTEEEFQLAVRFADAAALAIDNAHVRAELELQAQTDALTGLWNHRAFHERLRSELLQASVEQSSVALLMLDLDDFKRVNDVFGHATGDHVLVELSRQLRESVRQSDSVCRIGGEEFAVILPSSDVRVATSLARRVLARVERAGFGEAGRLSISVGVAVGPDHAANPRELVACAEMAMMAAKARGKRQVVLFGDDDQERPDAPGKERDAVRSIAHLKLLHHVSSKLTRLIDVADVGATVAVELRELIDYHNCRVFVRSGDELVPIAFRGDLTAPIDLSLAGLATRVGVGVTGHVAATGTTFVTGDAANCAIGHKIPGTDTIEESLLAVPLLYATDVIGVIVVSKLGLDQFDDDDVRLLEVVAGHASIALVNAQLYEAQRREAEGAKALLEFTREISAVTALDDVVDLIVSGAARLLEAGHARLWLARKRGDALTCLAEWNGPSGTIRHMAPDMLLDSAAAEPLLRRSPFVVGAPDASSDAAPLWKAVYHDATGPIAVAPIDTGGAVAFLVVWLGHESVLDERGCQLLAGVAGQARLALANALSFETLERTFLSTVEALANALEAKDEYTSSHARWIRDMSVDVGRELGLDHPSLKRLELAALFHDIGKIGIPAEILRKAGPLTDEERAVMETHPELGERILAPIDQLEDVRPIVRACHERFDGEGYPDRLDGARIPIEARIILACDAFHAMTTTRPYRRALPIDEARRRLVAASGTMFDPEVVDACLHVLDVRGDATP